ncbi:hypothetical protein HDU83_000051 [Entophlyctis luteolus]|nr:hypothetical protein HDU83_000051 [Entophlyctis luteolus]
MERPEDKTIDQLVALLSVAGVPLPAQRAKKQVYVDLYRAYASRIASSTGVSAPPLRASTSSNKTAAARASASSRSIVSSPAKFIDFEALASPRKNSTTAKDTHTLSRNVGQQDAFQGDNGTPGYHHSAKIPSPSVTDILDELDNQELSDSENNSDLENATSTSTTNSDASAFAWDTLEPARKPSSQAGARITSPKTVPPEITSKERGILSAGFVLALFCVWQHMEYRPSNSPYPSQSFEVFGIPAVDAVIVRVLPISRTCPIGAVCAGKTVVGCESPDDIVRWIFGAKAINDYAFVGWQFLIPEFLGGGKLVQCVPDTAKLRLEAKKQVQVENLIAYLDDVVRKWLGQLTCNEPDSDPSTTAEELLMATTSAGKAREIRGMPLPVAKRQLRALIGAKWTDEKFEEYWTLLLQRVLVGSDHGPPEEISSDTRHLYTTVDASGRYRLLQTTSPLIKSVPCILRQSIHSTLQKHAVEIAILVILAAAALVTYALKAAAARDAVVSATIIEDVLDALHGESENHRRDPLRHPVPGLGVAALRDHFLTVRVGDSSNVDAFGYSAVLDADRRTRWTVSDSATRDRIWRQVSSAIQRNANVRESVLEVRGEEDVVWQWIGSFALSPRKRRIVEKSTGGEISSAPKFSGNDVHDFNLGDGLVSGTMSVTTNWCDGNTYNVVILALTGNCNNASDVMKSFASIAWGGQSCWGPSSDGTQFWCTAVSGCPSASAVESFTLCGAVYVESTSIEVNVTQSTGALRYGATGFLYGVGDEGIPSQTMLQALKPRVAAQKAPGGLQHPNGDALKIAPMWNRTGGRDIQIYNQDIYENFPYENLGLADYLSKIQVQIESVLASPYHPMFIYVPINEPEGIWYTNNLTGMQEDWVTIHRFIRSFDPTARIAGPNFQIWRQAEMTTFLTYVNQYDAYPDVVTWHELQDDFYNGGWDTHLAQYRAIEASLGVGQHNVTINEYGRFSGDLGVPGHLVQYIAKFENSKVDGCLAYWTDAGSLNDLVTHNNMATGGWWLYKWYGELTGYTVDVDASSLSESLQGVAAVDSSKKQVRLVFGGNARTTALYNTTVAFPSLSSLGIFGSTVHATVWGVDNTGLNISTGPYFIEEIDIPTSSATIVLDNLLSLSAYQVILTPSLSWTTANVANRYEAEYAVIEGTAKITYGSNSGFSGTYFVEGYGNSQTANTIFVVQTDNLGYFTISLRYSAGPYTGAPSDRSILMRVNSEDLTVVALPGTSDWNTWKTASVTAFLPAGISRIEYKAYAADDRDAINIDYIDVIASSQISDKYEAEATQNTLSGTAVRTAVSSASGGYDVEGIGNGTLNYLQFNNILANVTGVHRLAITYANAELGAGAENYNTNVVDRLGQISVNGGPAFNVNFRNTLGWTIYWPIVVDINLVAGSTNTITIWNNSTGFAPNFDFIQVALPFV